MEIISWDKLCRSKETRGVGLRNHAWQNNALGAKLVWRMYKEPNLKWVKILRDKYLNDNDPIGILRVGNPPEALEHGISC